MPGTDDRLRLTYPEALPITAQRASLLEAIRDHQVVVVAGETGSGKSTQLPKLCLELGRGAERLVGHTQPRRLAARTVAARIAEELGTEVGDLVGYKVRFSDQVGQRTMVKLMTDGILLAELRSDPQLRRYDTIIVDEAHERSLNIDFLLGYLSDLLPRRPDLKVVVTSATIDTERFAGHFAAPVVEVSGRAYPVEVRYRPIGDTVPGRTADDDGDDPGPGSTAPPRGVDQVDAIRLAVDELRGEGPGDILVFLSGQREIHDTARALAELELPGTEILPLYARLSAAEQQRAFRPGRHRRRIVLATNVAETSITVPGVRYVVDTGTARISRYNRRTKLQRLPIEPVSQASANQRSGRCGRVAPGICLRLYSEDDLVARPEFTEPEILRTNLASVILQMTELGLGDVESFPFIDPPDARAVRDAVALLVELGALSPQMLSRADRRSRGGPVDGSRERPALTLTDDGRRMARLPVDPRFGRMLLAAEANGCLREVTVIVAALSIQDPRERPAGQEQEADELHARFAVPASDFLAYLNLWEHLAAEQRARSGNAFRRMCRAEHLNHVRVREWQDLVRQLREVAHELRLRRNDRAAEPDAVHRSLLAGLLSQVGMWDRATRDFRGARQARFTVASRSVMSRSSPAWVMAGELVETGRLWAGMVARIDPSWIEPLAGHLVRRHHGEPRWSRSQGMAVTDEQVTLYGLPVVPSRTVPLERIDPTQTRAMFVDHALVAGDWDDDGRYPFAEANRQMLDTARGLEARARRSDLAVGDERLADRYAERVPADVMSSRAFHRWWKDAAGRDRDALTFTLDDLLGRDAAAIDTAGFPLTWAQDDLVLDLSYVFEPGADEDGVTVHVPLVVLPRLAGSASLDWHVPGHRLELVTALIRTLPKPIRRALAPAQGRAEEALDGLASHDGPLLDVLARRLGVLAGTAVTPADLDMGRLPRHLRLRFSIEDADGAVVGSGRDLGTLSAALAERSRRAVAAATPGQPERSGLRAWPGGTLPRVIETDVGEGPRAMAYPTLVDEGETVGVRIVTNPADQERSMWAATRRLLLLAVPRAQSQVERRLRAEPGLGAVGRRAPGRAVGLTDLAADCVTGAADRLLAARGGPAWDEEGHRRLEQAAGDRLALLAVAAAAQAAGIVIAASALEDRLGNAPPALAPAIADIRDQLSRLVHPGFVTATGLTRLQHLARYVEAIRLRLDKLRERPDRDRDLMARARALEAAYDDLVAGLPPSRRSGADVGTARWMLEELRVSLFAQVLGTARPVSEQRVRHTLTALASAHGS
ncbi:MAG: ATP-dependent RNA helicase HrpA [Acidimicrobiales bacterium]